jgi:hypothetical protein
MPTHAGRTVRSPGQPSISTGTSYSVSYFNPFRTSRTDWPAPPLVIRVCPRSSRSRLSAQVRAASHLRCSTRIVYYQAEWHQRHQARHISWPRSDLYEDRVSRARKSRTWAQHYRLPRHRRRCDLAMLELDVRSPGVIFASPRSPSAYNRS